MVAIKLIRMNIMSFLTIVSTPIVLGLLVYCGGSNVVIVDQPRLPTGYWEKAWVDPQVVEMDPLFTLIRAARVDSFWVVLKGEWPPKAESVEFSIKVPSCFTVVEIHRHSGQKIGYPLVARQLPVGFYKLTPNPGIPLGDILPNESYYLLADVCGDTVISPVIR